jgi:iron complex transport system substrate-binding protein
MKIGRRSMLAGLSAAFLVRRSAHAQAVADGAGRQIQIPGKVTRVFPAGPPAAIMLYTLAPDLLLGWPRANRSPELEFLLPDIGRRPEVGRLTGRGNTANLEIVLALQPELIVDAGSVTETYVSLANRVQEQTGIPYALLNGRFDQIPVSYRTLGQLVGRTKEAQVLAAYAESTMSAVLARVARVPEAGRPRVYYARGPRGLETGLSGSINVETLEFLGARNVAAVRSGGLANVSLEQVLDWDPEVIVTIDQDFAAEVYKDSRWAPIAAVRRKRVHLSPKLPFGWVDFPPSVNRLVGLWWLGKVLYPEQFPDDLKDKTRDFYTRFYHVTPSEAQIERILAGRD